MAADDKRNVNPNTSSTTSSGGSYANSTSSGMSDSTRSMRDSIDYNAEEEYWRNNYSARPYYSEGTSFIEYKPAYKYGADAYSKNPNRTWEQSESELGRDWDKYKGTSSLTWERAKAATRDAWERVKNAFERAMPGDSDHDGR
jgi:hypothetical protein